MFTASPVRLYTMTRSIDGVFARRVIGILLQRNDGTSSIRSIGGDQNPGFRIVDAVAERFGTESAEDDVMRDSQPGARQHCDGEFRHHTHVNGGAVTLLDSERFQDVCKAANLIMQHLIAERADITRLALPKDGEFIAPSGVEVPIDAVV